MYYAYDARTGKPLKRINASWSVTSIAWDQVDSIEDATKFNSPEEVVKQIGKINFHPTKGIWYAKV